MENDSFAFLGPSLGGLN